MAVVQQPQAQALADPRDRAPQRERVGLVLLGRGAAGQLQVTAQLGVVAQQREIACDALGSRGIGTPLGAAVAVGLLGHLLANGRQGILAVGVLDMGQERSPFAQAVEAAPEPSTGRAHRRGRAIGLWEHPHRRQDKL